MRALFLGLTLLIANLTAQAQTSLAPMLKHSMPAIVNIQIEKASSSHASGTQGSGVILHSQHGTIVTNAHVVHHAVNVTVTLNDGRRFIGHVVGADPLTDLAIIHINATKLATLPINPTIHVGDYVTAIGSPFGLSQSVTSGIVSGMNRHLGIEGIENFIQTDAPINPGNSGGALLNQQGELVGINTAILSQAHGGNIGIGFAIPMSIVQPIIHQILKYGNVKHGILGVIAQDMTPSLASALGTSQTKGAIITEIFPKSPALKADLATKDVVLALNGHRVQSANDLRSLIGVQRPGTSVKLRLLHNGRIITKALTVQAPDSIHPPKTSFPLAGLRLSRYTELDVYGKTIQGVEVKAVVRGGQAWLSGVHPGDVILSINKQKVESLRELKTVLSKRTKNRDLLISVLRHHAKVLLALKA